MSQRGCTCRIIPASVKLEDSEIVGRTEFVACTIGTTYVLAAFVALNSFHHLLPFLQISKTDFVSRSQRSLNTPELSNWAVSNWTDYLSSGCRGCDGA